MIISPNNNGTISLGNQGTDSPTSGTMNLRPYRDVHKTAVSEVPLVIPVERMGALYNAYMTGDLEVLKTAMDAERALLSSEMNLYKRKDKWIATKSNIPVKM